jgi:hypothetical protein
MHLGRGSTGPPTNRTAPPVTREWWPPETTDADGCRHVAGPGARTIERSDRWNLIEENLYIGRSW